MQNQGKAVRTKNSNRTNPFVMVLMAALAIAALAGIILFVSGYRYISTSGVKFTGFVKDGQPVNGTVKYTDGVSGKLTKEEDSPLGKIVYNNGNVYEGELKGILRNGKGTVYYGLTSDGGYDEKYTGDFVDDEFTGYGECVSSDGTSYVGEILNAKKHGVGKFISPDGSYYYGAFENDMRNGCGEQHYADGSYYYGNFVDDKRSGSSEVSFTLENGMVYKGKNKMVYANGDTYVGDYLNDRKNGSGKYVWISGESYEGAFSGDTMHGTGTYNFGNGREPYTGEFVNGQLAPTDAAADTSVPVATPAA